jgi:hypothetical protein
MGRTERRRVRSLLITATVTATLCVIAPALSDAAKTDITVDYDKAFAFSRVRTWAWHPDGPGDVKLAVSAEADPTRVAARVNPVIVPAIEREMTARGLARATDAPDVYVHYYVLATVGQTAQVQGQFLPAVTQWAVPPFAATTSSLEIYPVGTLIIDMTSTAARTIVWRGAAARRLDFERPDDQRRKALDQAIRDLLKKFPPKT